MPSPFTFVSDYSDMSAFSMSWRTSMVLLALIFTIWRLMLGASIDFCESSRILSFLLPLLTSLKLELLSLNSPVASSLSSFFSSSSSDILSFSWRIYEFLFEYFWQQEKHGKSLETIKKKLGFLLRGTYWLLAVCWLCTAKPDFSEYWELSSLMKGEAEVAPLGEAWGITSSSCLSVLMTKSAFYYFSFIFLSFSS